MIRSLEGVRTLEELEELVFNRGYEFRCKKTRLPVMVATPVPINKIFLGLTDGTSRYFSIDQLHQSFELVKAKNNKRKLYVVKEPL
ncbi:hypothetical protein [Bacillus sp. PK3_68]|uniref:hypothetical protein n=1 Tax=Bacillus sp. PK3_68 TaxID=2027408 RepID=UPI000E7129EB|nr:hypothetical protein [Bacillus sp. PK3_68]RJS59125.1 hypothetical protein CJ483_02815 [Bacillus sp. PK3_68]